MLNSYFLKTEQQKEKNTISNKPMTEHFPGKRWLNLRAFLDSAASCWLLPNTASSQAKRCPGQRWVKLSAVRDSVESKLSVVWDNDESLVQSHAVFKFIASIVFFLFNNKNK